MTDAVVMSKLRFGVPAARWRGGRALGIADLAIFLALIVGDYYGIVPISSTPFLLVFGRISLWLRGLGWRDVGFARAPAWGRALLLAVSAGLAMELLSTFVSVPIVAHGTANSLAFVLIYFDRYPGL
jgi:hypothetical protein